MISHRGTTNGSAPLRASIIAKIRVLVRGVLYWRTILSKSWIFNALFASVEMQQNAIERD